VTSAKPIPDGYSTVIAYISVEGGNDALAFYKQAFGAEELGGIWLARDFSGPIDFGAGALVPMGPASGFLLRLAP